VCCRLTLHMEKMKGNIGYPNGLRLAFIYMLVLCFIFPASVLCQNKDGIFIDKAEERKAFELLNEIRRNPESYARELHYNKSLKVQTRPLKWNDTLARVAEARVYDMAKRDYFDHVNPEGFGINYLINKAGYRLNKEWLEDRSRNSFESIGMGLVGGDKAIKLLIIDEGVPSLGHRKHLLGLTEWNASLVDIGIGYAKRERDGEWETYICVIIAKHDW
jgi:uncharacterized protein YkwD